MPSDSEYPSLSISRRSYSRFSPVSSFPFRRLQPVAVMMKMTMLMMLMILFLAASSSPLRGAAETRADDVPGLVRDVDGDDVTVRTSLGEVRGKRRIGDVRSGGVTTTVDWFLGMPYAKPPVGGRRFQRPESLGPWTPRIREAFRHGSPCPQLATRGVWDIAPSLQSEDCLYLNVYSPYENNSRDAVYPVMVYVHGGSYKVGSGNIFVSHLLAQYGVVVVTINYRLGILGFLSANRPELEGNYGLLDQIIALEWIKANIRAFRGNPQDVTVFGNSAGGAAVGLLCVTPLAKGLFSKAIVQSGSPLAFWAVHNQTADLMKYVRALASQLSCNRQNLAELVSCLRTINWTAFVWGDEDDESFLEYHLPRITPMGIDVTPVVDGDVIPASPELLMREGDVVPTAVMAGIVEDEWLRLYPYFLEDLPNLESLLRPMLDGDVLTKLPRDLFRTLLHHVICQRFGYDEIIYDLVSQQYTSWETPEDDAENVNQYLKFGSDLVFLAPTVRMAETLNERNIPTFVYVFNHHRNGSATERQNFHQRELNYLFGSPFTGSRVYDDDGNYNDRDREVSRQMMRLWTNFAHTGNPNIGPIEGGDSSAVDSVTWSPYEPFNASYLEIGNGSLRPKQQLRTGKMRLWNHVIPGLVRRLGDGRSAETNSSSSAAAGEKSFFSGGTWILLGISISQLLLLIALFVVVVVRKREKRR